MVRIRALKLPFVTLCYLSGSLSIGGIAVVFMALKPRAILSKTCEPHSRRARIVGIESNL